jgi:peptide/nickel transport system substrate-binding protein
MIRNIRLQVVVAAAGLSLLGALLFSQARELVTILVPAQGGTYIEGVAGTPQFLNPLLSQYNQVDRDLTALLFDGLTRFDQQGGLEPRLARDWDISEDGQVYTFHLRPGVQWSDGEPFSAEDVAFTVGLLQDPGYNGPADVAALWRSVAVTQVNALEIQFGLPEAYAPFLDYTTIGVLPEHLLRGVTADGLLAHPFNQQPVGTGEFMLDGENPLRLVNGRIEQLLLQANPYFWNRQRRQVKLSKVEFKFYPDDTSVLAAYEAGEVQGVARVLPADLPRARQAQQLRFFTSRLSGYTLILLNTDNVEVPYLAEAAVRQALLLGLDRQSLIDGVLNGQGIVADSPILPGTWAHNPSAQRYEPNPAQARAIFDSAGWTLGGGGQRPGDDPTETGTVPADVRSHDGVVMAFTLLVSNDPQRLALGQAIAAQWDALGVRVTVQPVSGSLARDYLQPRRFEAALVDVYLPGDPDLYPFWHETQVDGGQNYAGYRDRDMSELLEQARLTPDRDERARLYYRFQDMFAREVPALLLYYPTYTYGVDQKVGGVQISGALADASDRFRNIADWYVVRRRVVTTER